MLHHFQEDFYDNFTRLAHDLRKNGNRGRVLCESVFLLYCSATVPTNLRYVII